LALAEQSRYPAIPALSELRANLKEWAERFRFTLRALLDTTLATLAVWTFDPPTAGRDFCYRRPTAIRSWVNDHCQIPFTVAGWDPRFEPRAEAEARIGQALDSYLDSVEKHVRRKKCNRKLVYARSPKKVCKEHFDWLALYQVAGLGYTAIGQRFKSGDTDKAHRRRAIAAGVKSAGRLVAGDQWKAWLRPADRGGRPRRPTRSRRQ
jgi:hypothetical protein